MLRTLYRTFAMLVIVTGTLFILGARFPAPVPVPLPNVSVYYNPLPEPEPLEPVGFGTVDEELARLGVDDLPRVVLGRVSAYNPVPRQTDGDPNVSSCGPNLPNQIAVSRDLFFDNGRKHLCGARAVLVSTDPRTGAVVDVRETVVFDTMNARYTLTADVYLDTTDESLAFAWGVRRGVLVILPDRDL